MFYIRLTEQVMTEQMLRKIVFRSVSLLALSLLANIAYADDNPWVTDERAKN